jgi:hypothetical protein
MKTIVVNKSEMLCLILKRMSHCGCKSDLGHFKAPNSNEKFKLRQFSHFFIIL